MFFQSIKPRDAVLLCIRSVNKSIARKQCLSPEPLKTYGVLIMTSISSIGSNNYIQSLSQVGQRNGMQPPPPPPDGDKQGKDGGGFLGAIDAALKSAGISGGLESLFGSQGTNSASTSTESTDTSSTTSTSTDASDALSSFLQNLMGALQSQGTAGNNTESTSDSTDKTSVDATTTAGVHRHFGGHGKQDMEAKLQSLISALNTSSDSSNTTASNTTTSGSTNENSALESSFQSLVSALGGSSSNASLSGFLQALSSNMQNRGPAGNVVSTEA